MLTKKEEQDLQRLLRPKGRTRRTARASTTNDEYMSYDSGADQSKVPLR